MATPFRSRKQHSGRGSASGDKHEAIRLIRRLWIGLAIWLMCGPVQAGPVISEFMASNAHTLADGDGDFSDWIEIHNPDPAPVNLGGYHLTDDPGNLAKWAFPADTVLGAGQYLIVFASGKQPPPAGELHANFKLDAAGEYLALVAPDGQTILQQFAPAFPPQYPDWSFGSGARVMETTWVPTGAVARALVPTSGSLGLTWTQPDFDDSDWLAGTTGVGYDQTPDYLPYIGLNVETELYDKNQSVYVRVPFVVSNAIHVTSLRLRLLYDDGIVVWLNGQPVYSDNAPAPPAYNSGALGTRADALAVVPIEVDLSAYASALRDGTNVLACQGLNATLTSSDLLLRPELLATITGASTGIGYMNTPTPGQPNTGSFSDPDARVTVSPASRTFTDSLTVTLASSNADATIRYTLDGSDPDVNSTVYTGPIRLTTTAAVRARAFLPGEDGTPVSGENYVHLGSDVQSFTSTLPVIIIENFGAGMIPDKRAANPPAGDGSGIRQVHRQPAWMGIFEQGDGGIASLTNSPTLETRIGIRVRGSSSALQPMGKENYSIESWSAVNEDAVNIRPFGLPAENDWILHAPYQYDRALIRNALVYELMREMGHYAVRTRFAQVFVHTDGGDLTMNDFSGVSVFMESIKKDLNRVDLTDFSADGTSGGWMVQCNRMDSLPEDGSNIPPYNFHTAGPNRIKEGPYGGSSSTDHGGDDIPVGYNNFFDFAEPSGYDTTQAQRDSIIAWFDHMEDALYSEDYRHPTRGFRQFLDLPSFIDHYIMVNLTRNVDGLQLSTYLFKRDTNTKLHLNPVWDYDRSMDSYDSRDDSTTGIYGMNYLWFPRLFSDPEFYQQYVDRWEELRRGPLSTSNLNAIIDGMAAEITEPIAAANFARWNASDNTPRAGGWPAEIQHIKDWLASRTAWIDSQYVGAPVPSSSGGQVTNSFQLSLSAPIGVVYYTLDGSDPRVAEVPGTDYTLLDQGAPAKALIPTAEMGEVWKGGNEPFDDSAWMPGPTGVGFDYPGLVGLDVSVMESVNASIFIRIPFTVPSALALNSITSLLLNMKFEDGFVAYLNGVPVAASNAPTPLHYDSYASASHPDADAVIFDTFDLSGDVGLLHPGTNILAFHALNRTADGTDLLVMPQLIASTGVQGGLAKTAIPYSGPFTVSPGQVVTARTLANGAWSGPIKAAFTPGSTDPAELAASLVLSEIMYHPPDLGATNGDDLEFLELQNTGTNMLDLGGLSFGAGIGFTFTNGTLLGSGQFFVLARNADAFASRYPGVPVNGVYTGKLDNGGDTISLHSPAGATIFSVTYDDIVPWPTTADGSGDSLHRLVLQDDGNNPTNWIGSLPSPGRPFDSDGDGLPDGWEIVYGTDPQVPDANADPDHDGVTNAQEYRTGTDPRDAASYFHLDIASDSGAVQLRLAAAAGRTYSIESSDRLSTDSWTTLFNISAAPTNRVVTLPVSPASPQGFYRLRTP